MYGGAARNDGCDGMEMGLACYKGTSMDDYLLDMVDWLHNLALDMYRYCVEAWVRCTAFGRIDGLAGWGFIIDRPVSRPRAPPQTTGLDWTGLNPACPGAAV
jgi:hypothetical protein